MAKAPVWCGGQQQKVLLKIAQIIIVVLNGRYGLLHLPADSPVLIQSGFAMLAIAKISAARKRQPEMIVSLSISPAHEAVNDVERMWWSLSKCDSECRETQGGCYQSNLAPLQQEPAVEVRLCILQQRSSFASSKREPPATKGSIRTHKSVTFQMPVVVQ